MLCGEILNVKTGHGQKTASVLMCRRWACEYCQPYCRGKVIRAGKDGAPNIFITLTCQPSRYQSPDDAALDMKRAFVLLRRRIFKRYKIKNLPFLVVFERTKKGWPHMHVLARATWIDQSWLSDQLADLIDAPIVDIRRIQDKGRAAAYVSKYVGKDPHGFAGCKRWWRSHNYDQGENKWEPIIIKNYDPDQWRGAIPVFISLFQAQGWTATRQSATFVFMQKESGP